jgi:hypothetical protein
MTDSLARGLAQISQDFCQRQLAGHFFSRRLFLTSLEAGQHSRYVEPCRTGQLAGGEAVTAVLAKEPCQGLSSMGDRFGAGRKNAHSGLGNSRTCGNQAGRIFVLHRTDHAASLPATTLVPAEGRNIHAGLAGSL